MLTDLSTLLSPARAQGYAVVAPDFVSLGMAAACLRAAEAAGAPIILAYHPGMMAPETGSVTEVLRRVRRLAERAAVPAALHLDHGVSLQEVIQAIQAGCSSVMIDGSTLPYAENAALTARTVEIARGAGVSVEAELGHVPTDVVYGRGEHSDHAGVFTDPAEAARFVADTGVDALAVSVGTRHGRYLGEPQIDFERLLELSQQVPVPLVLHGGSGTGAPNLRRAVAAGICKLNVYTDLVTAVKGAVRRAAGSSEAGLQEILGAANAALAAVMDSYFAITGSAGRY